MVAAAVMMAGAVAVAGVRAGAQAGDASEAVFQFTARHSNSSCQTMSVP